jgi:hypothetical protein
MPPYFVRQRSENAARGKLLSPARQRAAVRHTQDYCRVSQRRACQALGMTRSTVRYERRTDDEVARRLVARMHELVRLYLVTITG